MTDTGGTNENEQGPIAARLASGSWVRRRWAQLSVVVVAAAAVAMTALVVSNLHPASGSSGSGAKRGTAQESGGPAPEARGRASTHVASGAEFVAHTPEDIIAAMKVAPNLAAMLRKWNAGSGGAALDKVSSYMTAAAQSGALKMTAAMKQECFSLAAAVLAASAKPRIPNATIQGWYATALGELRTAAADCQSAISVQSSGENLQTEVKPAALHRAQTELAVGAKDLYRVTAQLAAADREGK
jgi:hypothetical protein